MGTNPPSTAATGGAAAMIWMRKQTAITASSAQTNASRKPEAAVHQDEDQERVERCDECAGGERKEPNRSFSAMAVPITSARSQAMIAASQMIQRREREPDAEIRRGTIARGRGQ